MSNLLGYALKQVREEQGQVQKLIADECQVTQASVSRWERDGHIPEEHIETAAGALKLSRAELVAALPRALAGKYVQSIEELNVWRAAVITSDHSAVAVRTILGCSLPQFLHHQSWFSEVRVHEIADSVHLAHDQVAAVWDEVIGSRFVEAITADQRLIRLRFP